MAWRHDSNCCGPKSKIQNPHFHREDHKKRGRYSPFSKRKAWDRPRDADQLKELLCHLQVISGAFGRWIEATRMKQGVSTGKFHGVIPTSGIPGNGGMNPYQIGGGTGAWHSWSPETRTPLRWSGITSVQESPWHHPVWSMVIHPMKPCMVMAIEIHMNMDWWPSPDKGV